MLPLELVIEKLGCGGEPFGVPRAALARGSEANIALCDLDAEWVVGEGGYESRSAKWSGARGDAAWAGAYDVAAGQVAYRLRSFSLGVA